MGIDRADRTLIDRALAELESFGFQIRLTKPHKPRQAADGREAGR